MADQNITELPVKTSSGITSSDYMLGIDSAEGYQMLIRDLGDYIIRNVQVNTIAGSNQTLKNALDTLNSNTYSLKETKTIPDNSDLNTFITEGCYSVGNNGAASLTHCPHNYAFKMIVERCLDSPTNWFRQTIIVGNAPSMMYRRHTINNGSTWSNWELLPQRSEIDTLNSKQSDTAGFHNGIYRGKNITSYLTDGTLWNRIKGTGGYALFADLYLGDYITVGNNSYAIVDFDYYLRCGSVDLNEHHIVMMPTGNMNIPEGTALYGVSGQTLQFINTANAGVTVSSQESATGFKWNAKMSDPNTHNTNGGYKYSRMRQIIMKAANTIVINAFGSSHVKPITVLYPNPSSESASGIASGWAWFANDDQSAADAKSLCDLPNETQIYGQQVWGRGTVYTNMGYEVGTDKFQFAICALQRNFVDTRAAWWLRSVYSASYAAHVTGAGDANNTGPANAHGVRPRFLLVG